MENTYNTYKTSTNYFNTKYRNIPNTKKSSYAVLKTDPSYYNQDFSRNSLMNSSTNENYDNMFSKILSKKKKRGILDISSPGNKDVLTDSDSETQTTKNPKNVENVNKNMNKKIKCAKLIIEKVESQTPQNNEEYYKFTNKKRINKDSGNIRYNNNMIKRLKSPLNDKNTNSFNNNIQYNNSRRIITQSRGFTNPKASKNQIRTSNNFYTNNSNNELNSNFRKINSTAISRDSSLKDNNNIYNYNFKNNNFGKSTNISNKPNNNYINYQKKKSPLLYRTTGNSIDKKNNSMNFIGNISNSKKPNITVNEFTTPVQSSSNNEDYSNLSKTSIGLKKNIIPRNRPQTTISLYDYKDLAKKPNIKDCLNLNVAKGPNNLIKSIIKIQSFWRGAFIRELMSFVGKLNKFIEILENLFLNHKKKIFFYLNSKNNFEKPKKIRISAGKNIKGPSVRQKYLFNNEKKEKPYQIKPKKEEEYIK